MRFGWSAGAATLLMLACSPGTTSVARPSPTPQSYRGGSFNPFMGGPDIPQPGWARVTAGTSEHICVIVGQADVYRSGDFVASLGHAFVVDWRQHPGQVKLGWVPRDPTQGPLLIHGERAGEGTYDDNLGYAISWAPDTGYFWPDVPSFKQPGRWTFRLIAGRESGCFIVDL